MPALPCTLVAWGVRIKLSKKEQNLNKSTERRTGDRKETRHGPISARPVSSCVNARRTVSTKTPGYQRQHDGAVTSVSVAVSASPLAS
jgi:hypothetical protein